MNWFTSPKQFQIYQNALVIVYGHARLFEEQGFSKQAVKEWLFEHCKILLDRFPKETSLIHYEEGFAMDGDRVCPCKSPGDILVVVTGGPEPYHVAYCGNFGDTTAVTKAVAVPGET